MFGERKEEQSVGAIYASDLPRAMETAEPIGRALGLEIQPMAAFRETNNGAVAGMKHELAEKLYPGVYWSALGWEEKYAGGESPKEFYERIAGAWEELTGILKEKGENAVLVTHGGVIQVILSLVDGRSYSNKKSLYKIKHAAVIPLEYKENKWIRKEQ